MRTRLQQLYESIEELGNTKILLDKHDSELKIMNNKFARMEDDYQDLMKENYRSREEANSKDKTIKDIQRRVQRVRDEKNKMR